MWDWEELAGRGWVDCSRELVVSGARVWDVEETLGVEGVQMLGGGVLLSA